jgi:hypothetical protein
VTCRGVVPEDEPAIVSGSQFEVTVIRREPLVENLGELDVLAG